MNSNPERSAFAVALYALFEPIPLGFFVAALIFDLIYINSFEVMWTHAASWLIVIGLVIAILPRLIRLVYLFIGSSRAEKTHFWITLLAIVLAIVNAFIHSRDAYAVVPTGATLSAIVVVLMLLANVQYALRQRTA